MDPNHTFFAANQKYWNHAATLHVQSDFYTPEAFKQGQSSLHDIELREVGEVRNKSLLHLQCHFGQDTLSWARRGAKVTGLDFSEEAIRLARSLSEELKIPAQFVHANVYDTRQHLHEQYDIVFTSYGVLGWLPDLERWAEVVTQSLKPGGIFYMVEFHPVLMLYDFARETMAYSYFNQGVIEEETTGTYAQRSDTETFREYMWNHSLSETLMALKNQGLQLDFLHEFPYSVYNCFPHMREVSPSQWVYGPAGELLPHLFSLRMRKG